MAVKNGMDFVRASLGRDQVSERQPLRVLEPRSVLYLGDQYRTHHNVGQALRSAIRISDHCNLEELHTGHR